MKFRVTLKDPDCLDDAIMEALDKNISPLGLPDDEENALIAIRGTNISDLCSTWFEYKEYLTVEIDTDARTCVVVPVRKP
jgi:hypothetical protein